MAGVSRAKIVYQPRATGCGNANIQESEVLSQLYLDYIKRTFPAQPRNRLILIRRSKKRKFNDQKGIEKVLEHAARDYNLTYTLFPDRPTPSLNETMMMFHSAVLIVGPHGAGLSNMIFSQPGTYVLEGVCNLPHVILCFQRLAHILGHHCIHWHGVTSRGGCEGVVDVPASLYQHYVERISWPVVVTVTVLVSLASVVVMCVVNSSALRDMRNVLNAATLAMKFPTE